MNCQQVNNLIWDYCDGLLSPDTRAEFETHLHECRACRESVSLARLENEAIRGLPDMAVSDSFTSRLMLNIAAPGQQGAAYPFTQKKRQWRIAFGPFSLVGAVAALLLMCFSFWPDLRQSSDQLALDNNNKRSYVKQDVAAGNSREETKQNKTGVGGLENNFAGPEPAAGNDSTGGKVLRSAQSELQPATEPETPSTMAPESSVLMAGSAKETTGLESLKEQPAFPVPANVPDTYQLLESTWENGTRVLVYALAGSKDTLKIKLAVANSPTSLSSTASRALKSGQVPNGDEARLPLDSADTAEANTVTRNLSYNNTVYLLTVQANLNPNALLDLANQIELREEKPAAEPQP